MAKYNSARTILPGFEEIRREEKVELGKSAGFNPGFLQKTKNANTELENNRRKHGDKDFHNSVG